MDDEKEKNRSLDYKPDIKYEEDYHTSYEGYIFSSRNENDNDEEDDLYDQSYMDNIQNTINELIQLIPNLTPELQTAINQVFKPIFNDWYKNLKKKKYPTRIPDPEKPIITPDDPTVFPPGIIIPTPPSIPPYEPEDPIITRPSYDPYNPEIFIPEYGDNPLPPSISRPLPSDFKIDDDGLFDPSTPFKVDYEDIDPITKIELEYVKNLAELYNYYTNRLSNTLGQYYLALFQAIVTSNRVNGESTSSYFLNNVSMADASVEDENLKHLADAAIRNEITAKNKLSFYTNMFSLESTLYHMKNYKAAYELRMRYEKEQMSKGNSDIDSMSNRMLRGQRENYNKKYDNAYINLYKHLNSSVNVLDDVLKTIIVGIRAKDTLYKKGGTSK